MLQEEYAVDFQQKGQWLLHKIHGEGYLFHTVVWNQYEGFDGDVFKQALNALIKRHESLRTTFKVVDGILVHKVHAFESLNTEIITTRHSPVIKEKTYFSDLIKREKALPFNLEEWPLFRINTVVENERTYVVYAIHHVIFDPMSLSIIDNEISSMYMHGIGTDKNDSEGRIQYRNYFGWKESLLGGEIGAKARKHWMPRLAEVKESFLLQEEAMEKRTMRWLNDKLNNEKNSAAKYEIEDKDLELLLKVMPLDGRKGELYKFYIGQEALAELEAFCLSNGYTLFMLLIAGFSITLNGITKRNCNLFAFTASDRENFVSDGMIGWLAGSAYFYSKIEVNYSFNEFLEYVVTEFSNAIEYNFYSIVHMLQDGNYLVPYNNIVPLYLNYILIYEDVLDTTSQYVTGQNVTVNHDLNCIIHKYNNAVEILCHYDHALFNPTFIKAMCDEYLCLLLWFIRNPDEKVMNYHLKVVEQNSPDII